MCALRHPIFFARPQLSQFPLTSPLLRHQEAQPQTPRLRRHACQGQKARREARQRSDQAAPRRTRIRPGKDGLRSSERAAVFRTTPTHRSARPLSRSELRGAGEDPVEVLCGGLFEDGAGAAVSGCGYQGAICAGAFG